MQLITKYRIDVPALTSQHRNCSFSFNFSLFVHPCSYTCNI